MERRDSFHMRCNRREIRQSKKINKNTTQFFSWENNKVGFYSIKIILTCANKRACGKQHSQMRTRQGQERVDLIQKGPHFRVVQSGPDDYVSK